MEGVFDLHTNTGTCAINESDHVGTSFDPSHLNLTSDNIRSFYSAPVNTRLLQKDLSHFFWISGGDMFRQNDRAVSLHEISYFPEKSFGKNLYSTNCRC